MGLRGTSREAANGKPISDRKRPFLLPAPDNSDVPVTVYSCPAFYINSAKGLQKAGLSGENPSAWLLICKGISVKNRCEIKGSHL